MKTPTREHIKKTARLFITGFTMGSADLVPGVSGGTIAFVSGIYEELIYSINAVTGKALKLLLQLQFKDSLKTIPWSFLVPLALGMFTAIFSLAGILSHLLETNGSLVWSFFFGLVLASTFVVARRVVRWDKIDIFALIATSVITFLAMGIRPAETSNSLPVLFISGAIAICAMILPGISGSFILVLIGKYQYILDSVTEKRFLSLFVFALGCVFGLSLFSRVLSWLFSKHHDISVAILSGFMLGSLRVIWPFGSEPNGPAEPLVYTYGLILLGMFIVLLLAKIDALKERTSDVNNNEFQKEHKHALEIEK